MTDAGAEQHFQQAQDKHRAGRLGDAVNLYRDTLARDPRHLGALFNLAQISLRRGNPAEAESLLRRAIAITPAEPAFHVSLSAALRADGRPAEAKASAEQALKLRANLPDAWNNLALAAMDLGDAALAEQAFARLLALDQRHADGLIGLGSLRLQQGRLDEAEQALGNAIRLRPNHPLAYIRLGDVFTARGRLMPAVEAYRRARTLDAGNLEAAEKYDRALANSGGAEAVRAGLEQAVTREPNNAMAHELPRVFVAPPRSTPTTSVCSPAWCRRARSRRPAIRTWPRFTAPTTACRRRASSANRWPSLWGKPSMTSASRYRRSTPMPKATR